MPEVNCASGSEPSVRPCAQARGDLIEPSPLMPAAGIQDPMLVRPSPSVLVLRYRRRTAIFAWLIRGYLLFGLPFIAWCVLQGESWFVALGCAGLAFLFWYGTLRDLILNKPVALARFDRGSRCFSMRNWFGLHRRRWPLSDVGAVQLVSFAGNT